MMTATNYDHLTEDLMYSNGLTYAAISFCASKTRQKYETDTHKVALRVRGGFISLNDAKKHMKKLDRKLDTYICELYKWILIGNVDATMDVNAHLVDMIKAHGLRLDHEKKRFEERKKAVMKDGLDGVPDELKETFDTPGDEDPIPTGSNLDTIDELTGSGDDQDGDDQDGDDNVDGISLSDVDTVRTGDYKFVAVSYVLPDPEFQTMETPVGVVAVKLRGIFETKEEAEKYVKETLSRVDPDHDILVADMYKFLTLPIDHSKIETTYREEYLQDMFSGYDKSQKAAKSFAQERDRLPDVERAVHPAELKAIDEQGVGSSGGEASGSG